MTAFYLKLFATPLIMLAISLAAKRWGNQIGGLLSGLPITSGLVMLFLGLEQGPEFATHAIPGALSGLVVIQATGLFYFQVTRRVSAFVGCLAALAFFPAVAFAVRHLGGVSLCIVTVLLLVAAIIVVISREARTSTPQPVVLPRWVIPMRMVTATLMLLAITASAQWLGPVVSGLLAPVPVIAWPLAVFAHVQGGRHELGAIVRGNAIGAVGVVGFYLTLMGTLLQWGIGTSIGVATLLAVVVTAVLARLLKGR